MMDIDASVAGADDKPSAWVAELPDVDEFLEGGASAVGVDVDDVTQPKYRSLDSWVGEWLAPLLRRRIVGSVHWCPRWWSHPEAVDRLGSLWAAWEAAQLEGGAAPSHWWLGHLDPHWHVLTSAYGPFSACTKDAHEPSPSPLPCEPPPSAPIAETHRP